MKHSMRLIPFCLACWMFMLPLELPAATPRPNIVWLVVEDMSAHYGCYGETAIATPNVDRLASEGVKFTRAFVTAPICSISRSALITGCYQTSLGVHNHRSSSQEFPITLPADVPLVPRLFREAGYHVNNLTVEDFLRVPEDGPAKANVKVAKTDYNFVWQPSETYHEQHWLAREKNTPFFVQVQFHGGKYRGQAPSTKWSDKVQKTLGSVTAASAVKLPPYLPDDPVIREDWAQYLDTVRYTDWEVGQIVERLRAAGELERTVIFFITDHGISHVRNKQFLYDGGTHIPLVVRGPGIAAGTVRADLVEHIDLAATSLALAGIAKPERMQARNILAADYQPRKFTFAARDRADETVDRIRSVRSAEYKYIRNYYPSRPYLQPNQYKDGKAIVQAMRRLHAEGKLSPQQALIMAEKRPREELYDLANDPFELNNVAGDAAHTAALESHRAALADWIARVGDRGREPEAEPVYRNYAGDERPEGGKGNKNVAFQENVQLMLRWAKERPMEE